jgi:S-DNA-T family DNA segregation ATPase FtsK/SpoIIIE
METIHKQESNINSTYAIDFIKKIKAYLETQEKIYLNILKDYEDNKSLLQNYQTTAIEKYKAEFKDAVDRINGRKTRTLGDLNNKKQVVETILELINEYENGSRFADIVNDDKINFSHLNYEQTTKFTDYHKKIFVKLYKGHFDDNKTDLNNFINFIDNIFAKLSEESIFHNYVSLKEKEYNLKISNMNDRLSTLKEKTTSEYVEKENIKILEIREFIENNFNNKSVENYISFAEQYDIKNNTYINPDKLIRHIKLGYIVEDISTDKKTFNNILNDMYYQSYYKDSLMKLPYCQSLSEGISLYIKTINSTRNTVQEYMKYIIMKLFLTIPAGKLEATFVDPLELGETFSMFAKLADEDNRIIDTRIWSKKEDITEKIKTFRQVLETRTQDYGTNKKEELLYKESIKLLAITDFPSGFSTEALSDLQAIIRKSSEYGIIVLISGTEISNSSAFLQIKKEIKDNIKILDMTTNQPFILNNGGKYRFIPEINHDILANSPYYIKEINKKISTYNRRTEIFENIFDEDIDDPNNWRNNVTLNGISIPIGIKGADSVLKLNLGVGTTQHALIAGQTGGGKTTLLHTIIMSMLLKYSADELQLYLADFKEGIEFKPYTELKCNSFRVIAIDSEREFGLNILEKLCRELKDRSEILSQEGCTDIVEYRKITKKKMPKIVLIFDEIHELLIKDDEITTKSLQCLNKLVTQGRALGIHLILACQDFRLAVGLNNLFSQIAIRIAIKGDEESAGSILSANNDGFKSLMTRPNGSAMYNERNGAATDNIYFQVAYLDKEKRLSYLETISSIEQSLNPNQEIKTKILLTRIEDNYFSKFNQFIINEYIDPISKNETSYGMIVGENFKIDGKFAFEFTSMPHSNLLLIGLDEEKAYSLFQYLCISVLYEELSNKNTIKNNELVDILDCSVINDELNDTTSDFEFLSVNFSNQVKRVEPRELDKLIDTLSIRLSKRIQGEESCNEKLFLMIFGIDRLHKLKESSPYQKSSLLVNLIQLIDQGSQYGINVIIWTKNISAIKSILGDSILSLFTLRIMLDGKEKEYEEIVHEYDSKNLKESTSVFIDIEDIKDNIHFRAYKIPSKKWIKQFSNVYKKYENS